jgi:hypothetical protein
MAYTTVPTKNPGDLLGSLDWNTYLRDNMAYLHSGRPTVQRVYYGGDIVSGHSGLADADPTNLSITISTTTGRALVTAMCSVSSGSGHVVGFGVSIDGAVAYTAAQALAALNPVTATIAYFVTGLTLGSHTFRLQWNPGGITTTLAANGMLPCLFGVAEI